MISKYKTTKEQKKLLNEFVIEKPNEKEAVIYWGMTVPKGSNLREMELQDEVRFMRKSVTPFNDIKNKEKIKGIFSEIDFERGSGVVVITDKTISWFNSTIYTKKRFRDPVLRSASSIVKKWNISDIERAWFSDEDATISFTKKTGETLEFIIDPICILDGNCEQYMAIKSIIQYFRAISLDDELLEKAKGFVKMAKKEGKNIMEQFEYIDKLYERGFIKDKNILKKCHVILKENFN